MTRRDLGQCGADRREGKYLIPGMMDLHAPAQSSFKGVAVNLPHFLKIFLAGGVTTIPAMGSAEDNLVRLKHDVDTGVVAGPNIVIGSFAPFEHAPGFARVERTEIVMQAGRIYRINQLTAELRKAP